MIRTPSSSRSRFWQRRRSTTSSFTSTASGSRPAGFDFLKRVPTWWDETRVLIARVGELLVTARRGGGIWYLGGMSAKAIPDISIPLSFLPLGRFKATLWRDGAEANLDPNRLDLETSIVSSTEVLRLGTAGGGGFVAELVPRRE